MGFLCTIGVHTWNGCQCVRCGKVRKVGHDYSRDCTTCSRCGSTGNGVHSWEGCECTKCQVTRDWEHDWSQNCEICAKCGRTRSGGKWSGGHIWEDGTCKVCGAEKPPPPLDLFTRQFIEIMSDGNYQPVTVEEIRKCLELPDMRSSYGYEVMVGGTQEEAAEFIYSVLSRNDRYPLSADEIGGLGIYRDICVDGERKVIPIRNFERVVGMVRTDYGFHQRLHTLGAFNSSGRFPCIVAAALCDLPNSDAFAREVGMQLLTVQEARGT